MSFYDFQNNMRYVQYEGALYDFAAYASLYGKNALILIGSNTIRQYVTEAIDASTKRIFGEEPRKEYLNCLRYKSSLKNAAMYAVPQRDFKYTYVDVRDKAISKKEVHKLAEMVKEGEYDIVVGVGGGKALDFPRAIAHLIPVKTILIPTTVSSAAASSQMSVVYSDDGSVIDEYWQNEVASELVFVDFTLIRRDKPAALSSGIGDMISTYYEALCYLSETGEEYMYPYEAIEELNSYIRIMREHGKEALDSLKEGKNSRALESIVAQIFYKVGPTRTMSGVGLAHYYDDLFLQFGAHNCPHGIRVGFATIAVLLYQGVPMEDVISYIEYCKSIDVEIDPNKIGIGHVTRDEWLKKMHSGPTGVAYELDFDRLADSIVKVKEIVTPYL